MPRAVGRRPDETSSPQSEKRGWETWMLGALIAVVVVLAVILVVMMAR